MKRKAGLFFAGFAAFACVFLAGCRMAQQPLLEFDRGAFERARAGWEAQGIESYVFEVWERSGGPLPGVRVTVSNGEVAGAELLGDPMPGSGDQVEFVLRRFGTIPALFDFVWSEYERMAANTDALGDGYYFFIRQTFSADYHFPAITSLGLGFRGGSLVCGSNSIQIRGFEPVW